MWREILQFVIRFDKSQSRKILFVRRSLHTIEECTDILDLIGIFFKTIKVLANAHSLCHPPGAGIAGGVLVFTDQFNFCIPAESVPNFIGLVVGLIVGYLLGSRMGKK
ncbi:hypothetical protein [Persicitalea sp.]|uniref:hypothetical protein n=1 Tax=Persicitalea sp. TaxID=3100273 RepID=UPI00359374F7